MQNISNRLWGFLPNKLHRRLLHLPVVGVFSSLHEHRPHEKGHRSALQDPTKGIGSLLIVFSLAVSGGTGSVRKGNPSVTER